MAMKKWIVGHPDRMLAKELAEECDIDPFAALIACGRGIDDASQLEQLLCDEPILCEPRELPDIERAAEIINNAIADDTLIAVFGDYDCDGVVSTAIMKDYLSSRGARVVTYIPDRENEGYGMNSSAVDKLHAMGVGLIVTVDNGIACHREIAYANSLSMQTVVTDHHLVPETLPEAAAVVDPHINGCAVSFREICGAEVAFKLICVLDDKEPEQLLPRYADILSVAVIADVMPLINENRSIVRAGLAKLKSSPSVGLSALMNVSAVERGGITAGKVAFSIAPRINAAGRMGDASRALELLLCTDMLEALKIANELDEENQSRRNNEKLILDEAIEQISQNGYDHDRVIVVAGDGWHAGTIGIVASKLTERYGRPSIVISIAGNEAHGSGRSISGFHLYKALTACSESLTKFGGHELAAGVSLVPEKIDELRRGINQYAAGMPTVAPEITLDFKLNPTGLSVSMVHAMQQLEPFGFGNPAPVFGIFGVKLEKINPIGGGKHLKLLFSKDTAVFQALLFGVTPQEFCFATGDILDLAVALDSNIYKEVENLSVQIKALRMSGVDDDRLFDEITAFDDFVSGVCIKRDVLLPTREEVGIVYKEILKAPVMSERLKHLFLNNIGYSKTKIAVEALKELLLVSEERGILSAVSGASRTELMNSKTYKKICEGTVE